MSADQFFSSTYTEARDQFLVRTRTGGFQLESFENRAHKGALGERLYTDVAFIGPGGAKNLLIIGSGTHGVEAFCGSGCQNGLVHAGMHNGLPADTALLLIHALNSYGFSHIRRVNEDNVDLNRNFQDFSRPLPENPAYDSLHSHLIPEDWFGPGRAAADRAIEDFIRIHGVAAFQAALTAGQYHVPEGLFYGGAGPVWSNLVLQTLVRRYGAGRARIIFIDVHTGLGAYGHGEGIFLGGSDTDSYSRAQGWFGKDLTLTTDGSSVSAEVSGPVSNPLHWYVPDSDFSVVSLEYGTRPVMQAANALRGDHWLYLHPDAPTDQRVQIKAAIRDAFYIEESRWKAMIWDRFREVFLRAIHSFR